MKEIEILVKVLEPKNVVLKKLSRFKIDHISHIVDEYYQNKHIKGLLPTKTKSSSEMLRIRVKDNKSYITYKKDVFTNTGWTYSDEYETGVNDAKIISDILKKLGFKPLIKVINKRTIYYYKSFEICLEEVQGLGLFLEIECIKPSKKKPEMIRDEILLLIKNLNLKVTKELMMGKGEMLYRKRFNRNGENDG